MHNQMKISINEKALTFYIDHGMMTQLGGIGSRILIYAKRITDGEYQCTIRESPQGNTRIVDNAKSLQLPFRIVFSHDRIPRPYDAFPHTPNGMPLLIKPQKSERSRQFDFVVKFDALRTGTPVTVPSRQKPKLRTGETVKSFGEIAVIGSGDSDIAEKVKAQLVDFNRQQQSPPVTFAAPKPVQPATAHDRLRYAISELNAALCAEVNDVELYAERFDENTTTVEKINLPVPSQLRIRGRIIKEETFE